MHEAMPIKSSSFYHKSIKNLCQSAIHAACDLRAMPFKYSRFAIQFIHFIDENSLVRFRSIEFDEHSNFTSAGRSDAGRGHSICHRLHCIGNSVPEAGQQVRISATYQLFIDSNFKYTCVLFVVIFSNFLFSPEILTELLFMLFFSTSRSVEENLKSSKHTQLPAMAADCQIEQKQLQARTTTPQISGLSTSMGSNCTGVSNNNDTRHHQIISDQEPPDGDETDPDVIPNQYGKCLFHQV